MITTEKTSKKAKLPGSGGKKITAHLIRASMVQKNSRKYKRTYGF
jgi:hypothetical protein